jgi:hypothetical protein
VDLARKGGKEGRSLSRDFDERRTLSSDSLDRWRLKMDDVELGNKLAAGGHYAF